MTSNFSRGRFNLKSYNKENMLSFQCVHIILRLHLFPVLEHAHLKFHRKSQFKKKNKTETPKTPETSPETKKTMAFFQGGTFAKLLLLQSLKTTQRSKDSNLKKPGPNSPTPSDPTKETIGSFFRGKMAENVYIW